MQMGKGPSWGYIADQWQDRRAGSSCIFVLSALPLPMTCRDIQPAGLYAAGAVLSLMYYSVPWSWPAPVTLAAALGTSFSLLVPL